MDPRRKAPASVNVSRKYDRGARPAAVAPRWPMPQTTRMPIRLTVAAALLLFTAAPVMASSSDWYEVEGGRVRIATSGQPDAQGRLRGVLDIDLAPGWKTYWRDPGDAGVPPTLDVSQSTNIAGAELAFPVPERFNDGYSNWVGYKHSVAVPVEFQLAQPDKPATIDAKVFLGICETICIPVSARLTLDPASDPSNLADAAAVSAAFAALPQPDSPEFGAVATRDAIDRLRVTATFPGAPSSAELFVASSDGYVLGTPERVEKDGKVTFEVPILDAPENAAAPSGFPYTLVTDAGAVSGVLQVR